MTNEQVKKELKKKRLLEKILCSKVLEDLKQIIDSETAKRLLTMSNWELQGAVNRYKSEMVDVFKKSSRTL